MHSSPSLERLRRLRGVAGLVVLGLLCRAWVPAGFMPAAIGAGGPVAVCHGGLAGEFFLRLDAARGQAAAAESSAGGHELHDEHLEHGARADHGSQGGPVETGTPDGQAPAAGHEGWDRCPFGSAFGAALLAADVLAELPGLGHALDAAPTSLPVTYRPVASYRARAPPSAAIHS